MGCLLEISMQAKYGSLPRWKEGVFLQLEWKAVYISRIRVNEQMGKMTNNPEIAKGCYKRNRLCQSWKVVQGELPGAGDSFCKGLWPAAHCLRNVGLFHRSLISWLCHTREINKRSLMLHASSSQRLIGNPSKMTRLIRSWFLE